MRLIGFGQLGAGLLVALAVGSIAQAATLDFPLSTPMVGPASILLAQTQPPSGRTTSITVLAPPRVEDYWVTATRQPGGVIVFDGFAPDDATRQRFAGVDGADITWLKLGSGEPGIYDAAVDFGLGVLSHLSEGRFALRSNVVTLTGNAETAEEAAAIAKLIAAMPAGLVLARNEIIAPEIVPTTPYIWSASRSADGQITLTGLVPTEALQTFSDLRVGEGATDETSIDPTAPEGFVQDVLAALDALATLNDGDVSFDGAKWSVSGELVPGATEDAVSAALAIAATPAAQWTVSVKTAPVPEPIEQPAAEPTEPQATEPATAEPAAIEPAPAEPAPAEPTTPAATEEKSKPEPQPEVPVVDPAYHFSAERTDQGVIALTGQVPTDPTLRYIGVVANAPTTSLTIASGAPDDFTASAVAGLRALTALGEGQLDFTQGKWTLSGAAADAVGRDAILADIAALPAGATWTLDITAPPAIEACRNVLVEFSARNAILFQSGAAVITDESRAALDELAVDLAACPDAAVHVEGHTDADGDEQSNLALSVARAEAVVAALIERGVAAERLYAIGYGESSPIADNETAAGKRLNRRIVVSVTNENN